MFGSKGTRVVNVRPERGKRHPTGTVSRQGPLLGDGRLSTFVTWDDDGETLWIHDEYLRLEDEDHEATKAWMNFLVQVTTHKLKIKPTPLAEQDFTDRELVCMATTLLVFSREYDEGTMLAGAFLSACEKINAKLGERVIPFDRAKEGLVTSDELRAVARVRG